MFLICRIILWSHHAKLVKTDKYTEINKQSYVMFRLDWRNMELSHIHSAVQERIIFYWIERDAKLIYIVWPTFIFTMKIRQKNLNLRNIWSFQSYGKYSWFGQLQRQFVKLLEVTSDALKFVPNTVVKQYWGWYEF